MKSVMIIVASLNLLLVVSGCKHEHGVDDDHSGHNMQWSGGSL